MRDYIKCGLEIKGDYRKHNFIVYLTQLQLDACRNDGLNVDPIVETVYPEIDEDDYVNEEIDELFLVDDNLADELGSLLGDDDD